jgi:hypothetical protein
MITTRTTIFRDNEDDAKNGCRRKRDILTAAIVSTAVGLLATKLYLLWFGHGLDDVSSS